MTDAEQIAGLRQTMEVVACDVRQLQTVMLRVQDRLATLEAVTGGFKGPVVAPLPDQREPEPGHLGAQAHLLNSREALAGVGVVAEDEGCLGCQ